MAVLLLLLPLLPLQPAAGTSLPRRRLCCVATPSGAPAGSGIDTAIEATAAAAAAALAASAMEADRLRGAPMLAMAASADAPCDAREEDGANDDGAGGGGSVVDWLCSGSDRSCATVTRGRGGEALSRPTHGDTWKAPSLAAWLRTASKKAWWHDRRGAGGTTAPRQAVGDDCGVTATEAAPQP